ncbi:MAG: right-handed parallel beta-helix repeat-containing protein, partial [Candidatus Hodarchaeales archaeon]
MLHKIRLNNYFQYNKEKKNILNFTVLFIVFAISIIHVSPIFNQKEENNQLKTPTTEELITSKEEFYNIFNKNPNLKGRGETHNQAVHVPFTGFIQNLGQKPDSSIHYYFSSRESSIGFGTSTIYFLQSISGDERQYESFEMTFKGANLVNPIGYDQMEHSTNYFINDIQKTDIPSFKEIWYHDIYPKIDLRYYMASEGLKYEFIVHPGANPNVIAIEVSNDVNLNTEPDRIVISSKTNNNKPILEDTNLKVFQEDGSVISANFLPQDSQSYQFQISNYDQDQILIIDPWLVGFTTNYGGLTGTDPRGGMVRDSSGNFYITGSCYSGIPLVNAYQSVYGGSIDAFIVKLNSTGNGIIFSTYLGGNSNDYGEAIHQDNSGIYVAGWTRSSNFPLKNAYDSMYNGSEEGWVAKLNTTGSDLIFSTYLGGDGQDIAWDIEIDQNNNSYVVGRTWASDFPVFNAYQGSIAGSSDVFITKFNTSGGVVFSTYFGGSSYDSGNGITLDSSGYIYITGYNQGGSLPTLNAYNATHGGSYESFIAKFNYTGNSLLYSTYIGGNGDELANEIKVDSSGNAYIAGWTSSTDFPTVNAYQSSYGGSIDLFATKLNSAGNGLIYSTYLGGTDEERATGGFVIEMDFTIDTSGNSYITASTTSTDFPLNNSIQSSYNGGTKDTVVIKLNSTGNGLLFSTYLGGSDNDEGKGIAIENDAIYIVGQTLSTNFPTNDGSLTLNGTMYGDVFLTKLEYEPPLYEDRSPISINGNADFNSQASSEGWVGSGTAIDPYIIEGYKITGTAGTEYLIYIQNTDVYFMINHSLLQGGNRGVYFSNVKNSVVKNLIVLNNTNTGLHLASTVDSTFFNNMVYNNGYDGFYLYSSSSKVFFKDNIAFNNTQRGYELRSSYNITLMDNIAYDNDQGFAVFENNIDNIFINNTVYNNDLGFAFYNGQKVNNTYSKNKVYNNNYGFFLSYLLYNNTFVGNIVYDNANTGFYLSSSSYNNTFLNNIVYGSTNGFYLSGTQNNTIISNQIFNNYDGFTSSTISETANNNISYNEIYNNSNYGFYLTGPSTNSSNNQILFNLFTNNGDYGIYLSGFVKDSTIKNNKFANNNLGSAQSFDSGTNNVFEYNYWDDWTSPDNNGDFIVDLPYSIDGTVSNSDSKPLVLYLTSHDPISINGNTAFHNQASSEGWTGNGTFINPYIIENYNIEGTGTEYLISILNTDVYFIINNSLLHGGNRGLHLQNVTNGLISNVYSYNNSQYGFLLTTSSKNNTLENNTVYYNGNYGFYITQSSEKNILTNNTAYNNTWDGFAFYLATNNTVTNNTAFTNSINEFYLSSSHNNTLTGNTAFSSGGSGFYLTGSDENVLTNNLVYDNVNGFYISSSSYNNLSSNIAYSNTNYGFYITSSNNNILTSNTAYDNTNGFYLMSSSNNEFSNNVGYNNNGDGFRLQSNCNYNVFTSNTAYSNTNHGFVFISSSNYNTLTKNDVYSNSNGFYLLTSSNNTFSENTVYNNAIYGFNFISSSDSNTVTNNQLINNNGGLKQGNDDCSNNIFIYNYWDDWTSPDINGDNIVDNPYTLDGTAGNQDNFPLKVSLVSHNPISIVSNSDFINQA